MRTVFLDGDEFRQISSRGEEPTELAATREFLALTHRKNEKRAPQKIQPTKSR